jgi:hypothetical protein
MSFPRGLPGLIAAVAVLSLGAPAGAAAGLSPELEAAWARPAALGGADAGYLRIDNRAGRPDLLLGAASPVAIDVSIHESRMAGPVMTMRPLKALVIPGGRSVTLAPGGVHLMIMGLKRPLRPGDRFPVTLTFAKAGRRSAEFLVASFPPGQGAAPMRK